MGQGQLSLMVGLYPCPENFKRDWPNVDDCALSKACEVTQFRLPISWHTADWVIRAFSFPDRIPYAGVD
ncbi:hypothetical protein GCM10008943_18570 [Paenochrobactrum glaciei]|uniref:Uncharacterized protein n=1 Tax=Paenochrobactrum glaciei TaxID=486407 RepID=A0ABN1G422_9HYPH